LLKIESVKFIKNNLYLITELKIEENFACISEYFDVFLPNGDLMFISISFAEYLEKKIKGF